MSFFKGLLNFIGKSFIGFGLTLFILSCFIGYALSDIGVLESSLKGALVANIQNNSGQANEYCNLNPQDPNCNFIFNPEQVIENDEAFNNMINSISMYDMYVNYLKIGSVLLFLIGFVLVYLGTGGLLITLYKISFSSTITSGLAILYYRFLPFLIDKAYNTINFGDIPDEALNMILDVINNWLYIPLQKTYSLAILITAFFLVITVTLFFIKKKVLYKKENKPKKEEKEDEGES